MNDHTLSSTHACVFDIETAPLPMDYLDMIAPEFEAQANLVDPVKIAANIAKKKADWIDRAALSPFTGKVLCIGIRDLDGLFTVIDGGGDEKTLLQEWTRTVDLYHKQNNFIGWNIAGFDLLFLQRRAIKHGVKPCIRFGWDYFRQDCFIDLMLLWKGRDKEIPGSLDAVSKFLGLGGKTGHGKDFHKLWETDKVAANVYLKTDIDLCYSIGERMGIIA